MNWLKSWVNVGILLAGAIVLAGAVLVYQAITVSLQAENTLHANYLVLAVVTSHLEKDNTEWPRSWDELMAAVPNQERGMYAWPKDLEELQQRVRIDFSLTVAQVSAMDPIDFNAVAPIGPHYPIGEGAVEQLLKAARKRSSQKQTTKP